MAQTENRGRALLIGNLRLLKQPVDGGDAQQISYCSDQKNRPFVDSASFVNNVKAQISRGLKTNMDANIFQVTEKADQMIQQFFQEKKEKPVVRVFLSQGG
ncbi:MAG: hypothetical protein HGA74_19095 [Deltaproteobacteria bacterium]|nr:hypothetical protein [Deltaproteobacteria bacterium]